jgi:hypothetical protein
MANSKFAVDISKWVDKANGNVRTATKKIIVDIAEKIKVATPVKDGYARNNWMQSFDAPDLSTTDVADKKPRMAAKMPEMPKGRDFSYYLTNSLPYIRRLEYGYSKQAPQGMVRLTVADYAGVALEAVEFTKRGGKV